jgi:cytoskeletal protein RodZ
MRCHEPTRTPVRRLSAVVIGVAALSLALSACAGAKPGDVTETTSAPTPTVSATPSATPTVAPTAEPTAEPTDAPTDPDAAVVAACDTLNVGYDQGRDGWLAARTQAAQLTSGAAAAGGRYADADATMQAFAATTYPGASSSADEVNGYLDAYLAVVTMCGDFGVTLKTE